MALVCDPRDPPLGLGMSLACAPAPADAPAPCPKVSRGGCFSELAPDLNSDGPVGPDFLVFWGNSCVFPKERKKRKRKGRRAAGAPQALAACVAPPPAPRLLRWFRSSALFRGLFGGGLSGQNHFCFSSLGLLHKVLVFCIKYRKGPRVREGRHDCFACAQKTAGALDGSVCARVGLARLAFAGGHAACWHAAVCGVPRLEAPVASPGLCEEACVLAAKKHGACL
jgi:hypothetical protein